MPFATTCRSLFLIAFVGIFALRATTFAAAITIPTVLVDNPGNSNDPATGNLYGGVAYNYRIATTEVTVGQYAAFLNAVAKTDSVGLYHSQMATDLNSAGISRSGSQGSFTYSVIGSPNHPIAYVNWTDAARFANWMHNGQPIGLQNAGTTEDGAYRMSDGTPASTFINRQVGARWFIPSESEWYKAAYHKGGAGDDYWFYPTQSDTVPFSDEPPGDDPPNHVNTANFQRNDFNVNTHYDDGFAVTPNAGSFVNASVNYLTDVGAYTEALGPYGTFDQAGNVAEWTEGLVPSGSNPGSSRIFRGGDWFNNLNQLQASRRTAVVPNFTGDNVGFRVATVPEPSAGLLAIMGCGLMWVLRKRLR